MGIGGKKEEIETRKVYFEDGKLLREFQVNKKGEKNGFYKQYHSNGELQVELSYTDGIQNGGTAVSFHSNGVKAREANVKKGSHELNQPSILDGEFTEWNEDGFLKKKGCYKDGKIFYVEDVISINEIIEFIKSNPEIEIKIDGFQEMDGYFQLSSDVESESIKHTDLFDGYNGQILTVETDKEGNQTVEFDPEFKERGISHITGEPIDDFFPNLKKPIYQISE